MIKYFILDFETYFDKDYSLSKLTYDEYVHHKNFYPYMVGIGDSIERVKIIRNPVYSDLSWVEDSIVVCHNASFDCHILAYYYGIVPKFIICTQSMARGLWPHEKHSLEALSQKLLGIGKIQDSLINVKGVRNLSEEQFSTIAKYCTRDVELTGRIFKKMLPFFSKRELKLINITHQWALQPRLHLSSLAQDALAKELDTRQDLLNNLGATEKDVGSDAKLANLFRKLGHEPETKITPKGNTKFAFATTDSAMQQLLEHDNEYIAALAECRLAIKSNITHSRLSRLEEIAKRHNRAIPIPLLYYGAHTGRWSGTQKLNMQNLPRKGILRELIIAPPCHKIIVADAAQIEARVLAWLAGQTDIVTLFATGQDVYCRKASELFGRVITKADEMERFIGKQAVLSLGYGSGWKKLALMLQQKKVILDINIARSLGISKADLKAFKDEHDISDIEWLVHSGCCKAIVQKYRLSVQNIVHFWRVCMNGITNNEEIKYVGPATNIQLSFGRIEMPVGLPMVYPDLKQDDEGKWSYQSRKGRTNIWPGAVVENIVQKFSREIIAEQLLEADRIGIKTVSMTHDEIIAVVTDEHAQTVLSQLCNIMSRPVAWAPGLPLAAEGGMGASYAEVKG